MTSQKPKLRAIFLATLMILSVFGGTIAFTGAVAAATNSASVTEVGNTDVTLGAGESGIVQTLEFSDSADNGNNLYIDQITLTPFDDDTHVEASDIDQIQLVVGGSTVKTVSVGDSYSSDGIVFKDFTGGNGAFTNSDYDGDSKGELQLVDGATEQIDVKVTFSSSATVDNGAKFEVDTTTIDALDDSEAGTTVETFGGNTTKDVTATNTLTLDTSTKPLVTSIDATNPSGQDVQVVVNTSADLAKLDVNLKDSSSSVLSSLAIGDFTESGPTNGYFEYTATTTVDQNVDVTAEITNAETSKGRSSSGQTDTVSLNPPMVENFAASFNTTTDTFNVTLDSNETLDASSITVDVVNSNFDTVTQLSSFELVDAENLTYQASFSPSANVEDTYYANLKAAQDNAGESVTNPDQQANAKVDTKAPTIADTNLTDAEDGDGSLAFGDRVTVTAQVTDGNAVQSVSADASAFGAGTVDLTDADGDANYTATFTVGAESKSIDDGSKSVDITAVDSFENSASATTKQLELVVIPTVVDASVTNAPLTDGEVGESNPQKIVIEFSEPMDTSANAPNVTLVEIGKSLNAVDNSSQYTWNSNTKLTISDVTIPDTDQRTEVTIRIADAVDTEGSVISPNPNEEFSFTIDTQSPRVTNVDVTDAPLNRADASEPQKVTVTFSEEMNSDSVPTVEVQDNDGNVLANVNEKKGTRDNGFGANDGFSSDARTWTGVIPADALNDDNYDGTATVVVAQSSAADLAGNTLEADANSGTFDVDTQAPDVDPAAGTTATVSGEVSLESYVKLATGDATGNVSTTYLLDGEVVTSTASYNTSLIADQDLTLNVEAVDDAGNENSLSGDGEEITLEVDNNDPNVTATAADGTPVSNVVAASELFDIEKGQNEQVVLYYKAQGDESFTLYDTFDSVSDAAFDTTELPSEGEYVFKAEVTGDASVTTAPSDTVEVEADNFDLDSKFDGDGLKVSSTDGTLHVEVKPEPGADFGSLTVDISRNDDFVGVEGYAAAANPGTLTLESGDFTQKTDSVGDVYYVADVNLESADGQYTVEVADATDSVGRTVSTTPSETATVDASAPEVVDAYIIGADADSTSVALVFSEPLSSAPTESGVEFKGEAATSVSDTSGGVSLPSNVYIAEFSGHLSTGDAANLTIAEGSYSEEFGGTSNMAGDETTLHTMKLFMQDGINTFSIPAANGEVDASELVSAAADSGAEVEVIWQYNASASTWESYDPDAASNDFTSLEAGTGYIVVMNGSAVLDVNVNNVPAGGANAAPVSRELSQGWNLVAHYQEGAQPTSVVFDSQVSSVLGQASGGSSVTYQPVNTLVPGEAYWVFAEEDGIPYSEAEYAAV